MKIFSPHKSNTNLIYNNTKSIWFLLLIFVMLMGMMFIQNNKYRVISDSMYPTLLTGDVVFLDQINCGVFPHSNDIVVFNNTYNDTTRLFVKRIYKVSTFENNKEKYYVLGDNSSNSYDSRSFGWISRSQIIGKVKLILWSWDEKNNKLRTDRILKKVD